MHQVEICEQSISGWQQSDLHMQPKYYLIENKNLPSKQDPHRL